jgi:hypothetical protein
MRFRGGFARWRGGGVWMWRRAAAGLGSFRSFMEASAIPKANEQGWVSAASFLEQTFLTCLICETWPSGVDRVAPVILFHWKDRGNVRNFPANSR